MNKKLILSQDGDFLGEFEVIKLKIRTDNLSEIHGYSHGVKFLLGIFGRDEGKNVFDEITKYQVGYLDSQFVKNMLFYIPQSEIR